MDQSISQKLQGQRLQSGVPQTPAHRKAALLISSIVSSGFLYFCYLLEHRQKQLSLTSVVVWNGQAAITIAKPTSPGEVHGQSVPLVLLESRALDCGLWGREVT